MRKIEEFLGNFYFLDRAILDLVYIAAILCAIWFFVSVKKHFRFPKKTRLSKYPVLPKIKFLLLTTFVAALVSVALARPVIEGGKSGIKSGSVDVIAVIDRSISMAAQDVLPSRLEIAKRENMVLVEKILQEGDRASVFIFGKDSFRKLYLANDRNRFAKEIIRIRFPKNIGGDESVWDTNLALTLEHVYQSLDRQDSFENFMRGNFRKKRAKRNRIVLIFTDGDDRTANKKLLQPVAEEFRKRGIRIYAVGIGTKRGYPLISLLNGYKKGEDYEEFILKEWAGGRTRLETEALEYIARATGGQLYILDNSEANSEKFLKNAIDSQRTFFVGGEEESKNHTELWRYVVYAALALLVLAIIFY